MEKGFWKKAITDACVYFSAVSAVIFIIKLIMTESNQYEQLFSVFRMLTLLGFCTVIAIANRILSIEKLSSFTKLLIHAALTFAGFFALIYAPLVADNKYQAGLISSTYTAPNIFVVVGIVAIVYAICYGIYFALSSKKNKSKNTKSEYKSVYRK